MKKIIVITIILVLAVIGAFLFILSKSLSYQPKCRFIKDCDFTYDPSPSNVWVANGLYSESGSAYTVGASWYEAGAPVNGRSTLMLMHALTPQLPSTINQTFYLPVIFANANAKYILRVSLANVGQYYFKSKACYDSRFVLKLIDSNDVENTLLDKVVNSNEGWKEFKFDISSYNAQNVTVQLESWVGNCNYFEGAFGAADYIDVELVS